MARAWLLFRCYCCCLVVGIFRVVISGTAEEHNNIDVLSTVPDNPSCISQSEFTSTLRKVEQLETLLASYDEKELGKTKSQLAESESQLGKTRSQLEETKSQLEKAKSQVAEADSKLADVTNEKATCDDVGEHLFQRIKEFEKDNTALKSQLEEKTSEQISCKNELQEFAKNSESLSSSCQSQIESISNRCSEDLARTNDKKNEADRSVEFAFNQCSKNLTTVELKVEKLQRELLEQEKKYQSKIENVMANMEKTKKQHNSEREKLQTELSKARSQLDKTHQDTYLFSLPQFKRTVAKVAALNKALVLFTRSKVEPILPELPPTLSDDLRVQYDQVRLSLLELYKFYVKPQTEVIAVMAVPHITTLRKVYDEKIAMHVNQARQIATGSTLTAWDSVAVQTRDYSKHMQSWIETRVVQPFIESHPIVRELIPTSSTDRLFALLYLLNIMIVSAFVMRILLSCFVKPTFRILRVILCCPFKSICWMFCHRRSSANKKVVKKEIRRENSVAARKQQQQENPATKKEAKKEVKKEQTRKSPPKRA